MTKYGLSIIMGNVNADQCYKSSFQEIHNVNKNGKRKIFKKKKKRKEDHVHVNCIYLRYNYDEGLRKTKQRERMECWTYVLG